MEFPTGLFVVVCGRQDGAGEERAKGERQRARGRVRLAIDSACGTGELVELARRPDELNFL